VHITPTYAITSRVWNMQGMQSGQSLVVENLHCSLPVLRVSLSHRNFCDRLSQYCIYYNVCAKIGRSWKLSQNEKSLGLSLRYINWSTYSGRLTYYLSTRRQHFLLRPLIFGTVFHRTSLLPPSTSYAVILKSHLFSLSYPAFWLFCHLYCAVTVTRHFGHYNRYYI